MKKFYSLAAKTMVFVLGVTVFTFAAVPIMDMLMTNYGSRTIIHIVVCLGFGLWLYERLFIRRKGKRNA